MPSHFTGGQWGLAETETIVPPQTGEAFRSSWDSAIQQVIAV